MAGERFCHLCGQRIIGRYTQYTTGLVVCQRCEATAPRCARCHVPLQTKGATRSPRGVMLCGPCSRDVHHCASCYEPILNVWYRFEELLPAPEPRHFCAACVRDKPRCDLCRAPAAPRGVTLTDGQYRCALCASDLVVGEPAIRLMYTTAIEAMDALTSAPLKRTPPLEVVSRRRMAEIRRAYAREGVDGGGLLPAPPSNAPGRATGGPGGAQAGQAGQAGQASQVEAPAPVSHLLGFYVRSQGKAMIYVEAGLTRGMLLGTLAHELGHAWQAEQIGHGAGAIDPLNSEGFAEWIAYKALLARGFRTLATRARDRQDIYGQGLNRLLALEASRGREAALQAGRVGHF